MFIVTGINRYLRQVGTAKTTRKKNTGFIERFEQVETAFKLFGFTDQVRK